MRRVWFVQRWALGVHVLFCIMLSLSVLHVPPGQSYGSNLFLKFLFNSLHYGWAMVSPDFLLWKGHIFHGCREFKWRLIVFGLGKCTVSLPCLAPSGFSRWSMGENMCELSRGHVDPRVRMGLWARYQLPMGGVALLQWEPQLFHMPVWEAIQVITLLIETETSCKRLEKCIIFLIYRHNGVIFSVLITSIQCLETLP